VFVLKEKRIMQIFELLKRDGEVEINVLCRMFNVTDMTIRRDLETLSKEHNIVRTHGGAILVVEDQMVEPSYERRIISKGDQKEKIAKKALELIKSSNKIFIDSGTTTYYMATNMSNDNRNVVVTNGLNIASEIINRRYISVLLIGGDLRRNTLSTRGALAEEQLQKFKVDIAFLGANTIGDDGNIYVGSTSETGFKKYVIQSAAQTYILLDSSKFDSYNLISYTHARDVTGIITDDQVSEESVNRLREMGVNIIIAS
jgi:DeoR/GlpR family transcriptional regulator of sugar metabolism